MVRKSKINKRATKDKTSSPRKSTRSTWRRKKSTSESEPDIPVEVKIKHDNQKPETSDAHTRLTISTHVWNTSDSQDKIETPPEVLKEEKTFRESQTVKIEETPTENSDEGTTWKVQSSNGSGGEIPKLKIGRQRLTDSAESSSLPTKESLSPRMKRYTKRVTKGDKHGVESAESSSSPTDSKALTQSETPESEIQQEKPEKKSSELKNPEKRVKKPFEPEEMEKNKSEEESSYKTLSIEHSIMIDEKKEIAKNLIERAAAKEAPEENKKSEVKRTELNDDNDKKPEETSELDTSREKDEISSAASTPEPKHKITIIDSRVKPVPLKRLLEEELSQRERRKSKKIKPQKESQIVISSLTLKTLVPDVAPVPLEEVKKLLTIDEEMNKVGSERKRSLHDSSKEPEELFLECTNYERSLSPEIKKSIKDPNEKPKTPEEEIQVENEEVKEPKKKIVIKPTEETENSQENLKTTRKISIVSDDAKTLKRSLSPSAKKATNVLYITNLVRLFTVTQLKDLLARTGTLAENGFFIDKFKSKCLVKYTSVEMAVETRQALHGVRWPFNNPKTLKVEYSTEENLNVMLRLAEKERSAAIKQEVAAIHRNSDKLEKELKEALIEKPITKVSRRVTLMREWDMGKMAGVENHTQNEVAEDDKKVKEWGKKHKNKTEVENKRRIHSPENAELPRKMKKKDTKGLAKLMDGLFPKTEAKPCIYWLPLTTTQIAVKDEMWRQHTTEQRKTDSRHDKKKDIIRIKGRNSDREKERERDINKDKIRKK